MNTILFEWGVNIEKAFESDTINQMISHLTGKIIDKGLNHVVIDVNGVGYKIFVSTNTLTNLNKVKKDGITTIHTYLAVRENAMDLYGFEDAEEKKFFELLLTISGIGPKSAIGILSTATAETIREGVISENHEYFSKISGIGKKTAEKIIIGLKDKIGMGEVGGKQNASDNSIVIEALASLGYTEKDAREVMKKIKTEDRSDHQKIIKEALKILSGK